MSEWILFFVCFRGTIEGWSVDEAVGGGVRLTGKSEDVYSCRRLMTWPESDGHKDRPKVTTSPQK